MHFSIATKAGGSLRALVRVLIVLLAVALTVLGLDVGLGLYDEMMDPACKLGGLLAPPRPLAPGVNRIVFRERYRITGLQFMLVGESLRENDLSALQEGLSGSLHAWMGEDPQSGREWRYIFTVVAQSTIKQPAVESVAERFMPGVASVALGVSYDVQCDLRPAPASRAAAAAFHAAEFPADVPLTLLLTLDHPVAGKLKLQMSYAKLPRSLFPRRKAQEAGASNLNTRNPAPS